MKKYLAALLAMAMTVTALAGCGNSGSDTPAADNGEGEGGETYKVAYIARAQSEPHRHRIAGI